MKTVITLLLWFCALGCGLMAGVYFAFSTFIMTALGRAGHAGTVAMNSINAVILRSTFMPLFFGTTLGACALAVFGALQLTSLRGQLMVAGGLIYFGGMFSVTVLCNVPLNHALTAVVDPSRVGTAIWNDYLRRWTRWNHVRTFSSLATSAAFMAAIGV